MSYHPGLLNLPFSLLSKNFLKNHPQYFLKRSGERSCYSSLFVMLHRVEVTALRRELDEDHTPLDV